jgi:hypothetical protein
MARERHEQWHPGSSALEGGGSLQHGGIGDVTADELEPDGQPIRRHPGRDTRRRLSGEVRREKRWRPGIVIAGMGARSWPDLRGQAEMAGMARLALAADHSAP